MLVLAASETYKSWWGEIYSLTAHSICECYRFRISWDIYHHNIVCDSYCTVMHISSAFKSYRNAQD